MVLKRFVKEAKPIIEKELRGYINTFSPSGTSHFQEMLKYHLGWVGEDSGEEAQGKRIRPILVLLCTEAVGGAWKNSIPAAAAVEFLHNFSLIHDDIQDKSDLRRGRVTVWKKWGIAQAINAGDLMFTISYLSMLDLKKNTSYEIAWEASSLLQKACVELTGGQYLDLDFETRKTVSLDDYWKMIGGKTAALLGCCAELGGLIGGNNSVKRTALREYGKHLGLAFQVWDDWLGIWGDSALTGKSTESDLVCGKKTIPVLFALEKHGKFYDRWIKGNIQQTEVPEIVKWMEDSGAKKFTEYKAEELTVKAMEFMKGAVVGNDAALALEELTNALLTRQK